MRGKIFKNRLSDNEISDLYRMLWEASKPPLRLERTKAGITIAFRIYPTGAISIDLLNQIYKTILNDSKFPSILLFGFNL